MKKSGRIILISLLAALSCNIAFTQGTQATLIASGASWKYLDNGSNQGTAWRNAAFDDAAWASGNAQLGYGDGDEATVVGYGPTRNSKYITTYFRKAITIGSPAQYSGYTLNVKRDDGIVVYMNGVERYRNNISATATITYTTLAAVAADDGATWQTVALPAGLLTSGSNIIAVEVHQCWPDNADISFDFELIATQAPIVTDNTPPAVTSLFPADDSINVNKNSNLSMTFNEPIVKGTGNILIKENGVTTQSINVASEAVTVAGNTITIDPSNFTNSAAVNIEMAAGVFKDTANNNYAGITSTTLWNFSVPATVISTLIAPGSSWKYLDNGSNQGTAWRNAAFDDASWASGNAQLGYGDGDEATVVGYGPNRTAKYITTYFRKTITVADPSLYTGFTLNVKRDDGIVVYVNGVEKFRNNISATATITYTTLAAVAADDGATWQTVALPAGLLTSGSNIIAVEIHQCWPDNADISFDLELKATENEVTDPTPPLVTTLSPTDNASNVSSTSGLIMTFNENIQKGTGNILIKEAGIVTQTIDVVSASVTVLNNTVTITPAAFTYNAAVNIEMPAGTFKDIANNNYAGISNTTAWNFTVQQAPDITAPVVNTYSPVPNATNVANNESLVMTFSENIQKGTGSILIKENGITTQSIDVTSAAVVVSNNTVTITHSIFAYSTVANIEMPAGTFKDFANINFAGITNATTWSFIIQQTPDMTPPVVNTYSPVPNATNVATNASLTMTFNENIQKGTGSILIKQNGTASQAIDVTSASVTIVNNTVTISHTAFTNATTVNIEMPAGAFKDISNNNYEGISNATTWSFTIQAAVDMTPPAITTLSPADNATNVNRTSNLVITFNENVQKGSGSIVIKEGGITKQVIDVASAAVTVAGNIVTIDPASFSSSAAVNIEMPAGVFKDLANNNFAGITNAATWNFSATTAATGALIAYGSPWKYLDNGTNQGTTWKDVSFNDAAWASGNAELGYGDGDEATVISYGPNSSAKYITSYFRKSIAVTDASLYSSYTLNLRRDDGVIVYINGVEKFRSNMPAGAVTYTTAATAAASDDGDVVQTITLPAGLLATGTNIIAAELHQNSGTSSDLSFDLELNASDSTDVSAPTVTVYSPGDNATNIATNAALALTFNETVQKGTGNITIKEGGIVRQTIDVTSASVTVSGATVTITPSAFTASAAVNIEMPAGVLKDFANNNFAGITNATTWNFSIAGGATTTLTRGPYLQMGTSNSVVIRWRSAAGTDTKVSYGLSAASLTSNVSNASVLTEHEIQLTGLTPDTKYFYSIGSSTQTLQGDANNYFVTAPVVGAEKKIRVWVNGDCGNNSTNQRNVRDQLVNYMGTNYTDVWLLLGDNAYDDGTDAEFQTKFFDIYKDKMLKQTVLWPSPGNHDYADNSARANDHAIPYYSMFTLPTAAQAGGVASNTEAFYSYNYGNTHFISLDSYGREGNTYRLYDTLGPQVVWLKQDLAANTQKWTIVYWHHAPYSLTSHNSDTENELINIRQNLLRILERYKVDLVLCGHSHGYERSKLLKGHYGNEASFTTAMNVSQSNGKYDGSASSCPYVKSNTSSYNGTVYVVAGSAGQLSSSTQASYPHAAMYYSNVSNGGSMVLEIEANRLDAKWVCADGVIRDNFTIEKDVSVKKNVSITAGGSTTLTASWIGNYNWTGGATTRSITVTPAASTSYIVNDGINCVADTFDVTVAAARPISKTAVTGEKQLAVKVYPNPTSGNMVIEYTSPAEGYVNMEIIDITGKRIKMLVNQPKKPGAYKYVINTKTERLKPGIYSVRLTAGKQKILQRFIVTQE